MNLLGRVGIALAAAMAAYMAYNAFQAWTDPSAFAVRLGLPLQSSGSGGWVGVYALRAAFIALLLAGLTYARQWRALFLFTVAALIMPLGDAWLTYSSGAGPAVYGRHLMIAAIIALLAALLAQAARTAKE